MPNVIRVALPGFNAITDSDPRHFSLMSDQDNILIKEKTRGTASFVNGETISFVHNLTYAPHFFVYGQVGAGTYKLVNGYDTLLAWRAKVNNTNLSITNNSGTTNPAKYFIFYDNIT